MKILLIALVGCADSMMSAHPFESGHERSALAPLLKEDRKALPY